MAVFNYLTARHQIELISTIEQGALALGHFLLDETNFMKDRILCLTAQCSTWQSRLHLRT